jgi:hypothetical protein
MTADTSVHRKTWDQIPWIINGTLSSDDLKEAAEHLQGCSDCREELEFQRHIARSMAGTESLDVDPHLSWQQLRERIEASGSAASDVASNVAPAVPGSPQLFAPSRWTGWLVAAMVVQAIGLGVLGTALWSRPAEVAGSHGVYRTLSAAQPEIAAPTIRVVFAADMSIAQMQALLSGAGLQVVSGPSSAGVWSLAPSGMTGHTATQSALQQLRDSTDVRFAEATAGAP